MFSCQHSLKAQHQFLAHEKNPKAAIIGHTSFDVSSWMNGMKEIHKPKPAVASSETTYATAEKPRPCPDRTRVQTLAMQYSTRSGPIRSRQNASSHITASELTNKDSRKDLHPSPIRHPVHNVLRRRQEANIPVNPVMHGAPSSCSTMTSAHNDRDHLHKTATTRDNKTSQNQRMNNLESEIPPTRIWKTAVDPKSGRTYYYDYHTREAQWGKPLELATEQERLAIALKEQQQREFFAAMEENILQSMDRGCLIPSSSPSQSASKKLGTEMNASKRFEKKLVRTISSMDDQLLMELLKIEDSTAGERSDLFLSSIAESSSSPSVTSTSWSSSSSEYSLKNEDEFSEPIEDMVTSVSLCDSELTKPKLSKRNTCGTMYIGSTMAAPDKDALIKCVCGVFRAHLLGSTESYEDSFHLSDIFHDDLSRKFSAHASRNSTTLMPSLDEITAFYSHVFHKAQIELNCIIMSLIYVERLIRNTHGRMRPTSSNWMSVLLACMILSSKVWDDLSMWNVDFSKIGLKDMMFNLKRINQLEIALLSCLQYKVQVSASEYAKYYFLLRSWTIRSGLASDELRRMSPLDAEGAKKLNQKVDSLFSKPVDFRLFRSKSMGSLPSVRPTTPKMKHLSLEEIVKMT